MSDICVMFPCVRDKQGNVVESKLFEGLLSLPHSSKEEIWQYYNMATDPAFLSSIKQDYKVDENGEIILSDFVEIIESRGLNVNTLAVLNKELQTGEYSFEEGMKRVAGFNRRRSSDSKYMATILPGPKNKVKITIVNNTAEEQRNLQKFIEGRSTQDQIIAHLNKAGVSVSFINENISRYSTENAQQNAQGLYELIEYSKTGATIHLAEEAGHFIVGAMNSNPLLERLLRLLNDDVIAQLLPNFEETTSPGDKWREAAGQLVGQELMNKLEAGPIRNLVQRLITAAKKFFAKISHNQLKLDILEAQEIARQFVQDFLNDELTDGTKEALKVVETLHHQAVTSEQKAYQIIVDNISKLAEELRPMNKELSDQLVSALMALPKAYSSTQESVLEQHFDLLSTIQLVLSLNSILQSPQIQELLNSEVQYKLLSPLEVTAKLQEDGRHLAVLAKLIDYMTAIDVQLEVLKDRIPSELFNNTTHEKDAFVNALNIIKQATKGGASVQNSLYAAFINRAQVYTATLMSSLYGAEYIEQHNRLSWKAQAWRDQKLKPADQLALSSFTAQQIKDDSDFVSLFSSLSYSADIGAQFIDTLLRDAEHQANLKTAEDRDTLKILRAKAKEAGISSFDVFYEKDENGVITGNLLTIAEIPSTGIFETGDDGSLHSNNSFIVSFAEYKQKYKEFKQSAYAEFIDSTEGQQFAHMPLHIKRMKFKDWFAKKEAKFLRENLETVIVNGERRKVPKQRVYPSSWKPLSAYGFTKQQLQWYDEFLEFYEDVQSRMGSKAMAFNLAPQVIATGVDEVANIMKYEDSNAFAAVGKKIWRSVVRNLSRQPKDTNTAGHYAYGTEEDKRNDKISKYFSMSISELNNPKDLIPIYYTSPLEDPRQVDTNLLSTTMQLASMANRYSMLSMWRGAIETASATFRQRTVVKPEGETKPREQTQSKANKRINESIDYRLYGINRGILRKLANYFPHLHNTIKLAGDASVFYLLGFNIPSQVINVGTGVLEMTKEALTGEYMDIQSFGRAMGEYAKESGKLIADGILDEDSAKINLYASVMNIFDEEKEVKEKLRDAGYRVFSHSISKTAMLGYAVGDHMMQTVPYMAMGMAKILYTEQGAQTTLWDAYTVETIGDVNKLTRNVLFSNPKNIKLWQDIQALIDRCDSIQINTADILKEEFISDRVFQDFAKQKGADIPHLRAQLADNRMSREELRRMLAIRADQLTFSATDEQHFAHQCRLTTNEMHGIYDDASTPAFHRTLPGVLLGKMKRYAYGMVDKRFRGMFGGGFFNITRKSDTDGYLTTTAQLGLRTMHDLGFAVGNAILASFTSGEQQEEAWNSCKHFTQRFFKSGCFMALPWNLKRSNTWAQDKADALEMTQHQIRNIRRTWLDYLFIFGLKVLYNMVRAIASGTDNEEELRGMTIEELKEFIEQNGFTATISKRKKQSWRKQAKETYRTDSEKRDAFYWKKYKEDLIDQILDQQAEIAREEHGWAQAGTYVLNRLYREQAAFNLLSVFGAESTSLLDPLPIAFNFIYDVWRLADGYVVTEKFRKEKVNVNNEDMSIEDALNIAQLTANEWNDLYLELHPKTQLSKSAIQQRHKEYRDAIIETWTSKKYGTKDEFAKYFYTKSKRSKYPRFYPKYKATLDMKLPWNKLNYIFTDGVGATDDYNFGSKYN